MGTKHLTADPIAIIRTLDSDTIIERLRELDQETRALRELLRVARARDSRRPPRQPKEVQHAE